MRSDMPSEQQTGNFNFGAILDAPHHCYMIEHFVRLGRNEWLFHYATTFTSLKAAIGHCAKKYGTEYPFRIYKKNGKAISLVFDSTVQGQELKCDNCSLAITKYPIIALERSEALTVYYHKGCFDGRTKGGK